MKYFTPQDVVEAWKRGEINRFKVRMYRNTARRCGYPEREKCFDDALKLLMNCVKLRKNNRQEKEKTMSETTEKKRQPRTCFHIPDEVFQVLFKEARSRRITVTDYILDMLKREAETLSNKSK